MQVNQATEPLYIVKPFSGGGIAALFSTHPPIEERVRRLRQMRPDASASQLMAYRVLSSGDAFWRPSNQMKVENTDLAKQLEAETLGARLWRLHPGQASHQAPALRSEHELYVVLEGTGRMRVDDEVLTLEPLSALLVEPEHLRQVFNDTDGTPLAGRRRAAGGRASTLEMTEEQLAAMYPDGPKGAAARARRRQFDG